MTVKTYSALDPNGLALLQKRVDGFIGKTWAAVRMSYGGEIRIDIGELTRNRRGKQKGEWILGTRGSPWTLERQGSRLCCGGEEERIWVDSLHVVQGRVIRAVRVMVPGPDLTIEIEDGYRFAILPSREPEWVAWELFCADGSRVAAWCDGRWTDGRRDEVDDAD
jgi:hypothetical protein